jgi:four helix bundle protein
VPTIVRHARAKSTADFISKTGTVEKEAGESLSWLEVLVERRLVADKQVAELRAEAEDFNPQPAIRDRQFV